MAQEITRRETLRKGLAATSLLALIPDWATPALAQGETEVPFTDIPKTFNPNNPNSPTRMLDIRKIDGPLTPKDQFFAVNHFSRPAVDPSTFRLKFTGMVNKPAEFSIAELRAMKSTELICGFECSGNSPRSMQGLSSCARFTGVRLETVLKQLGVQPRAREVVFFGADRGPQDVVFRQQTFKLEQQFGRSMTLENAMKPEPLLAYALNGDPLTREQGFPLRLVVPGWYGVANVKWLSEVHLQEDRYLGNYQARWYRTLRGVGGTGEETDPGTQWVETEVTRMQLKSVIARVSKAGGAHQILGFVLNDGTPLKSVEVQVDGGSWQKAKLDSSSAQYAWKLFTYRWEGATPGEHTIVSRVTDMKGEVQPESAGLSRKKTFLEDNAQFPRKVMIG
ncbi:MAG TPA: molybdopterin-dependent oxidoreductase [Bryobacteraceae bacterium]|jgi:DMSO/TMAO reductase YedYZ molybdopterin-dependent catalytic subunit|nr:molybdopterin-dependent oxidoreductase [Bryobacteraceae bacterium]